MCDTSTVYAIGENITREGAEVTSPSGGGNGGRAITQPTAPASAIRAVRPLL